MPGGITGRVMDEAGRPVPHPNVTVSVRGLPDHACTRIYFGDEAKSNESDMVLNLVARREDSAGGPVYRFDTLLQGDAEIVFFDA